MWDLLVSPVTFVRPLEDSAELEALVTANLDARVLAFTARAIGTWMLVSLALAVRRYLRN